MHAEPEDPTPFVDFFRAPVRFGCPRTEITVPFSVLGLPLREADPAMCTFFTNLVETDMLWGHRNDPVNFHRCLQDFDRRLPDLLDALRPGDLFVLTSDHGCDPTTPSTDHSREHALLLAYVQGRNANGSRHDGEFADVGATVNAWLGGKAPGRGIPGQPIVTP